MGEEAHDLGKAAPAAEAARYCRKCGYALRGLTTPRCPECGRGFDPANGRTFRRRPLRRWMRWVWRAGMALATVVLLLAGFWGWEYWDWKLEQRALAALKPVDSRQSPHLPDWLDGPSHQRANWLKAQLGPIGFVLDRTTFLDIRGSHADFLPLAQLHRVKYIIFLDTNVGELSPIAHLVDLESLCIDGGAVTELSPLAGLPNLNWLRLSGLPALKDCGGLAKVTGLRQLLLFDTSVSDLTPLAGLPHLERLDLKGSPVRNLAPLYGVKSLHSLIVDLETPADQIDGLQRALPGCSINWFELDGQ